MGRLLTDVIPLTHLGQPVGIQSPSYIYRVTVSTQQLPVPPHETDFNFFSPFYRPIPVHASRPPITNPHAHTHTHMYTRAYACTSIRTYMPTNAHAHTRITSSGQGFRRIEPPESAPGILQNVSPGCHYPQQKLSPNQGARSILSLSLSLSHTHTHTHHNHSSLPMAGA